jgi:alanine dehydrogenase
VPTAVGIPKEIKDREGRVSMQPDAVVDELHHGREAIVQSGASKDSGFSGEEYESAGGRVVESTGEIFEAADLIVNVKEPIPVEYDRFREEQELFTYLHLAADRELPEILIERKIDALAYEAVELPDGSLPLLAPMSEVAGRMSVRAAAHCLESTQGGAGLLLGGNLVSEPVAEAHDLPHTSQEWVLG